MTLKVLFLQGFEQNGFGLGLGHIACQFSPTNGTAKQVNMNYNATNFYEFPQFS